MLINLIFDHVHDQYAYLSIKGSGTRAVPFCNVRSLGPMLGCNKLVMLDKL